ncbi:MAG: sodium:solute symporter [Saprospiraceae bacterium]|nr:sodium:solute symporter [Saprospiraceae bacterium]
MDHAGLLSILPPILAIVLAIWTRQVFFALGVGVWSGYLILADGNILDSFFSTLQGLVTVFEDAGNTRTILFCALVGALIVLIQKSGGVEGFIIRIQQLLDRLEARGNTNTRKLVPILAWLLGVIIFVETSISSLTVGTLFRPLFDKLKLSREKLAWIADSSSAPASILIPFNGWGAFIMGLLAAQGFEDPFSSMLKALVWNFYPMLTLLMVPAFIWFGFNLKGMALAEKRVSETGKLLPDGAQPMVSEEITAVETKPGIVPKGRNMIFPLAVMVVLMPIVLAYTGWEAAFEINPDAGFFDKLFVAIGKGSGSTAVLSAVTLSILFAFVLYRAQGFFKLGELMDMTLKGISGLVPLALLMVLAFAIGAVCKQLGTGIFLAEVSNQYLSPGLIPAIIFITSSLIAFSTGTSWGTFAIMLAIAIPMAREMGTDVYLAIAAALGGGVFGDHCSPISDTTIISSMSAACDHIDHVRTQIPYAILAGAATVVMYLIAGMM